MGFQYADISYVSIGKQSPYRPRTRVGVGGGFSFGYQF